MTNYSPDSPDQTRATCEPTAEPSELDSHASSADAVNTAATHTEENAAAAMPTKKAAIAAFSFPFSPSVFAPSQSDDQSWHQKGNQSAHHKTPSRTPNGSRRSMGKR